MDEMINLTDSFLLELKNKTENILLANIDSEINYIFTNDEEYLNKRTRLIPRSGQPEKAMIKQSPAEPKEKDKEKDKKEKEEERNKRDRPDTKEERDRLKKEAERMFVKELRLRVEHYFKITIRTLRVLHLINLGNNSKEYWIFLSQGIPVSYAVFSVQRASQK